MLGLLAALLVRVQILGLLHPHAATISTPRGELHVRAVGDALHEGVGPPLPFLKVAAPPSGAKPLALKLDRFPRRVFSGALEIRAHAGELSIFNEVPLEEYVASVVGAELPGKIPLEAAKALAVVARSYAVYAIAKGGGIQSGAASADKGGAGVNSGPRNAQSGGVSGNSAAHPESPLCDSTHCQLYQGISSASKIARAAASSTEGLGLLLPSGAVAPALHHAACGGRTSRAREVWPEASDDDEVASAEIDDKLPDGTPACAPRKGEPPLDWRETIDESTLSRALGVSPPLALNIERGEGDRLRTLTVNGHAFGADALHLALGRALGWNRIRSSRIYWTDATSAPGSTDDREWQHAHPEVSKSPARFVVRGSGYGHGVGLCQRGALHWAQAGESFRRILSRYFPKLTVGRLPMTPVPG